MYINYINVIYYIYTIVLFFVGERTKFKEGSNREAAKINIFLMEVPLRGVGGKALLLRKKNTFLGTFNKLKYVRLPLDSRGGGGKVFCGFPYC